MEDSVASAIPSRGRDTSHLKTQHLENLDVSKLNPLTPEVISRQATINIGMHSKDFSELQYP
jgi:hypothetical protein